MREARARRGMFKASSAEKESLGADIAAGALCEEAGAAYDDLPELMGDCLCLYTHLVQCSRLSSG